MKEQSKSSTQPNEATAPPPPSGPLAEFAELLKGAKPAETSPAEGETPPAEGETPPLAKAKKKPKDLSEAAELLGVGAADLYALQIPSAVEGAEPYTLGKLKDLAAEQDTFTLRTLKLEDDARKRQAGVMRAEQELADLFAALPPDAIKPETRAALQQRRDAALRKERQLVLDVIPEWRDEAVRTGEIQSIMQHLQDYGFPEAYFAGVHDHRTIRYIRANWQREMQIRAALEKVTERKSNPPPKSKPHATPQKKPSGLAPREHRESANFAKTILSNSRS